MPTERTDNRIREHSCGWWTGTVTCQLCGLLWVGVWCDCSNAGALQCPQCMAYAGMPDPPEIPIAYD